MRTIALKRRRVAIILVLLAVVFVATWFAGRTPQHPLFGRVHVARMSESYSDTEPFWQVRRKLADTARTLLHLRPKGPPTGSDHGVNTDYGLHVGPSLLGWSSHANSSTNSNGYIYMRDERPTGGNQPLWEFALSTKQRLSEVTREDLRCEFYGMDDPKGRNAFGTAWEGAAILVPEGQIFLARLVANRSLIYVVRLAKQGGIRSGRASMQIEYLIATNEPPNNPDAGNSRPARQLTVL